jgi:hypothetical protein
MYYEHQIGNTPLDLPSKIDIRGNVYKNKHTHDWCSSKQVELNRFITDLNKAVQKTLGQGVVKLEPYPRSINIEADNFGYFQIRSLFAGYGLVFPQNMSWAVFDAIERQLQQQLPKCSEYHINKEVNKILFAIVFEDGENLSNTFMNDHMDSATVVLLKHLK